MFDSDEDDSDDDGGPLGRHEHVAHCCDLDSSVIWPEQRWQVIAMTGRKCGSHRARARMTIERSGLLDTIERSICILIERSICILIERSICILIESNLYISPVWNDM